MNAAAPLDTMAVPRCPVTRDERVFPLCEVDGFRIWRCPASATDFVWPAPSPRELKDLYDREAWFEGAEAGGYANYDQQTAHSLPMVESLLASFDDSSPRYVLDVGCGYGTHLGQAADRGWKCFGVEVSDHARKVAIERHGERAYIVGRVEDLIPHEFDLVLILDVLEHVADPYAFLFPLFSQGLIGPKTRVVVSTPNARSADAVRHPATWLYRHPPSHLVYYSTRSLRCLFETLLFDRIDVSGTAVLAGDGDGEAVHADESLDASEACADAAGLLCDMQGSSFYGFMQERFVPGTWSKLAEYEHMPRYQFASRFANGARVLDFGCGTGYGSRALAATAASVVGLDIDEAALTWARFWHRHANLRFERHDDLGAKLPSASFDLVTCFEMIEHVDFETQQATVSSLARLVKPTGMLVISTPNPGVTANYGDNPYHLREMDELEFRALLEPSFEYVTILRQRMRPAILIADETTADDSMRIDVLPGSDAIDEPAAFIALCGHAPIAPSPALCTLDPSVDLVLAEIERQRTVTGLRLEAYQLGERAVDAARELRALTAHAADRETVIAGRDASVAERDAVIAQRNADIGARDAVLAEREAVIAERDSVIAEREARLARRESDIADLETRIAAAQALIVEQKDVGNRLSARCDEVAARLAALEATRAVRLARLVRGHGATATPVREAIRLVAGGLLPRRLRGRLRPAPATGPVTDPTTEHVVESPHFAPYVVKIGAISSARRPRVLHAIANFMTGGSSRLVVDLIERLGGEYEQRVLTSFIPDPPAYVGVDLVELRSHHDAAAIDRVVASFRPDIVHVHYWGESDAPWYRQVFDAATRPGIRVVQNINTPVAPYADTPVDRNVFVSRYVLEHFGTKSPRDLVIYPGSDFSLFVSDARTPQAQRCIGMVYRLERDKLDDDAIVPFIRAAQRAPEIKCLIVGGGSLLAAFKQRTLDAGVEQNFEFTGYVAYDRLPEVYRRMDVFVAPIWKESFGQVSAFAMNMGIAVIGYDVGAISEIVDDPTLIAAPGDADALADIALRLVNDDALRERVGRRNRQRTAHQYSVEAMVDQYRDLYRSLLEADA